MAKKSDTPGYHASSPASGSGSVGAERLPYVSGSIPEQAAAEPLPDCDLLCLQQLGNSETL